MRRDGNGRTGGQVLLFAQGSIIAALLGVLVGLTTRPSDAVQAERRAETAQVRRAATAVARAHMLVIP